MRVYTQEEFDSLPVVDGIRYCPTGDYSAVQNFSERCSFDFGCIFGDHHIFGVLYIFGAANHFGSGCSFGFGCNFSDWCKFGASNSFGEQCIFSGWSDFGPRCGFGDQCSFGPGCGFSGRRTRPGFPLLALSGAGSVNRTVYAFNVESGGPWFEAGCFSGDIDTFREKSERMATSSNAYSILDLPI